MSSSDDISNRRGHNDNEIQCLLEHLTLQNEAYSSSNKLLMKHNNSLKQQNSNLTNLLKTLIYIMSKRGDEYCSLKENESISKLLDLCKLSWFESVYNFLNLTSSNIETVLISPLISDKKQEFSCETVFELNLSLVKSEIELKAEETVSLFYSDIVDSLNLIHNSKLIKRTIFDLLSLLSCKSNDKQDVFYNVYYAELHNKSKDTEQGIIITTTESQPDSSLLNEGLEFIDLSKYFSFEKCIVFNRHNLRFLVLSQTGNLCWSDRVSDMNAQFLQDYNFLFKFDNARRKLVFNIISSFNQFIANFIIGSIDKLKIDKSPFCFNRIIGHELKKKTENGHSIANSSSSLPDNNSGLVPLTIHETLEKILLLLTEDSSFINPKLISPGSKNKDFKSGQDNIENCVYTNNTSIISSINSFKTCTSQGLNLEKIDISSASINVSDKLKESSDFPIPISVYSDSNSEEKNSDFRSNCTKYRRSNSQITTLSEFLRDDFHLSCSKEGNDEQVSCPESGENVSIDFFFNEDFHTCEWVLL